MAGYFAGDFPFETVGGYACVQDAVAAGYDRNQIWSVAFCGTITSYGPAHHTTGIDHYVVTNERHDGDTYYEESDDGDEDDDVSEAG